jgi:hypothetical protein
MAARMPKTFSLKDVSIALACICIALAFDLSRMEDQAEKPEQIVLIEQPVEAPRLTAQQRDKAKLFLANAFRRICPAMRVKISKTLSLKTNDDETLIGAVAQFQAHAQLTADGMPGADTITKLFGTDIRDAVCPVYGSLTINNRMLQNYQDVTKIDGTPYIKNSNLPAKLKQLYPGIHILEFATDAIVPVIILPNENLTISPKTMRYKRATLLSASHQVMLRFSHSTDYNQCHHVQLQAFGVHKPWSQNWTLVRSGGCENPGIDFQEINAANIFIAGGDYRRTGKPLRHKHLQRRKNKIWMRDLQDYNATLSVDQLKTITCCGRAIKTLTHFPNADLVVAIFDPATPHVQSGTKQKKNREKKLQSVLLPIPKNKK